MMIWTRHVSTVWLFFPFVRLLCVLRIDISDISLWHLLLFFLNFHPCLRFWGLLKDSICYTLMICVTKFWQKKLSHVSEILFWLLLAIAEAKWGGNFMVTVYTFICLKMTLFSTFYHVSRYELCFNGEKAVSNGTIPGSSHVTEAEPDKVQNHSLHVQTTDKNMDRENIIDVFRWSRCKKPLPQNIMRSIGIPLPLDHLEVLYCLFCAFVFFGLLCIKKIPFLFFIVYFYPFWMLSRVTCGFAKRHRLKTAYDMK